VRVTFNLDIGTFVGPATQFTNQNINNISPTTPLHLNSNLNYIGFHFTNEATGQIDYGYIRISLSDTVEGQPRGIVEYAYENTGSGMNVGTVPEPSTFALLALMATGAAGLRAWRSRR
jgi:hypothetical protein